MTFAWGMILGAFIGAILGYFTACFIILGGRGDE